MRSSTNGPSRCSSDCISGWASSGFENALPGFERYLESLGHFEKNRFEFPGDVVEAVNEHWGFALDAFDYARIQPGEIPI